MAKPRLMLWLTPSLIHTVLYIYNSHFFSNKRKMQHETNTFPITNPSQRYYSPLYTRQQIDIFYDLAQLAHTIIFNETHVNSTTKLPLFIDPQVVASSFAVKQDPNVYYVYVYRIQYKLDQDEDSEPLVLNIELFGDRHNHSKRFTHTKIMETLKDSLYLNFSVVYKRGTFIYDKEASIDLLRIWLLIPRATISRAIIYLQYDKLEKQYTAQKKKIFYIQYSRNSY